MKNFSLFLLIVYQIVTLSAQTPHDSFLGEILEDIDGNVYATTAIGNQVWMAENLRVTKYNDGMAIPQVTKKVWWRDLAVGSYCWYNNDSAKYASEFGALYNWNAVNTGNLCPSGWHVPDKTDWHYLIFANLNAIIYNGNYYNIDSLMNNDTIMFNVLFNAYDTLGFSALPMAPKFKLQNEKYWGASDKSLKAVSVSISSMPNFIFLTDSISEAEINETKFSALPGGIRMHTGKFYFLDYAGYWWSKSLGNKKKPFCFKLFDADNYGLERGGDVSFNQTIAAQGFSVRCVKD